MGWAGMLGLICVTEVPLSLLLLLLTLEYSCPSPQQSSAPPGREKSALKHRTWAMAQLGILV